jgi:two-component system response regulator AtoC
MARNCPLPIVDFSELGTEEIQFVSGISPAMQALERAIADLARSEVSVLVLGDTGTGKRTLAQRIHTASPWRGDGLMSLNCSSVSPEFFDHEQWAKSEGKRPGTLLLHEISDLSSSCQSRLLNSYFNHSQQSNRPGQPRIIVTSSRNLDLEVQQDRLREDLYYRMRGVCLQVPPLRHRKEDIPGLIDFFLDKYAKERGTPRPQLSVRTVHSLLEHPWPGNVRQLQDTLKTIVKDGPEAVPLENAAVSTGTQSRNQAQILSLKYAARAASQQAERELILEVLSRTHWNRKMAAKMLQISYKALLYKLKQIGMDSGYSSQP